MKRYVAAARTLTILLIMWPAARSSANGQEPAKANDVKEWMSQNRARKGAVLGAAIGAVVGAAWSRGSRKDREKSAVVGGALGPLVGFAIGKDKDQLQAGVMRPSARLDISVPRLHGKRAASESGSCPARARRDGHLLRALHRRWPGCRESIKVKLFCGMKYDGDYVVGIGPNEFVVPRGGGIGESGMELTLPRKTPAGTYGLEALLEDPQGRFPQTTGTSALYLVARTDARDQDGQH